MVNILLNLRDTPKEQQCELLRLQINKLKLINLESLFSICGFGFAVLCFFFCLRCLFAFNYPGPSLSLTSKTPCAALAGRRAPRYHSHAIANVSWRMRWRMLLLLQRLLVLLPNELFLVCLPHSKGMSPAVWRPLLWSRDYLLFHRSSGGSKQSLPDVGFITSSGTTIFFMGTLVFKVLSDHCDYKKLHLHAQKLL